MNRMTLEEDRKIMGSDAPYISDDQLEETIGHLEAIAAMTIKSIMSGEIKIGDIASDKIKA